MKALRTLALCLVSTSLAATSVTALAQKPAIVKDVEAKGRIPYIYTLETPCSLDNPASCPVLTYSFPAVPAGYRLVVTHVSAQFITTMTNPIDMYVVLSNGQTALDTDYKAMTLPYPVCSGNTANVKAMCVSNGPISFYVEQGFTPKVIIHTGRALIAYNPEVERVTVVGYLLSL